MSVVRTPPTQNGPRPLRDESLDSRGTTLIGTECPLNGVRDNTPASVMAGASSQVYSRPSQAAFGWQLRKDFRWVCRARLPPVHRALCAPVPTYSFPSSPLLYIVSHMIVVLSNARRVVSSASPTAREQGLLDVSHLSPKMSPYRARTARVSFGAEMMYVLR